MKTEFAAAQSPKHLQDYINDFIKDKKVIDIKYSVAGTSSSSMFSDGGIVPTIVYSALVMYQDTENEAD